jgi:hypothetical protein
MPERGKSGIAIVSKTYIRRAAADGKQRTLNVHTAAGLAAAAPKRPPGRHKSP